MLNRYCTNLKQIYLRYFTGMSCFLLHVCMYVCMRGWAKRSSSCTTTFNVLLCFPFLINPLLSLHLESCFLFLPTTAVFNVPNNYNPTRTPSKTITEKIWSVLLYHLKNKNIASVNIYLHLIQHLVSKGSSITCWPKLYISHFSCSQ